MNLPDFEKVTGNITQAALPLTEEEWKLKRAPEARQNQELAHPTFMWLAQLPGNMRPASLARQYPRIANKIAELWKLPLYCERYFDELMIDRRGNRLGFPPKIAAEIATLKVYFMINVSPLPYGLWGEQINKME